LWLQVGGNALLYWGVIFEYLTSAEHLQFKEVAELVKLRRGP
jgi:hypothetical protein